MCLGVLGRIWGGWGGNSRGLGGLGSRMLGGGVWAGVDGMVEMKDALGMQWMNWLGVVVLGGVVGAQGLGAGQGGGPAEPDGDPRVTREVQVVERCKDAVVLVEAYRRVDGDGPGSVRVEGPGGVRIEGSVMLTTASGVLIDEGGVVLTSDHVARAAGPSGLLFVWTRPNDPKARFLARVLSSSPEDDLCLLEIEGDEPFPTVAIGSSKGVMLGEPVIAIGNPLGEWHSVSAGIVSGLDRVMNHGGRRYTSLLQTDAAINRGNSGGPLLNIHGEMIGLLTMTKAAAENMAYAIPMDRIMVVLRERLMNPSAAQMWFGFEVVPGAALESAPGVATWVVSHVAEEGPAWGAGLRAGDRVVAAGGAPLEDRTQLDFLRLRLLPGETLGLRVECSGQEQELGFPGWPRVDGILYDRLGMTLERHHAGGFSYLAVDRIRPGGPAEGLGLRRDDVLLALSAQEEGEAFRFSAPDEVVRFLNTQDPGGWIQIEILRDANGNRRQEPDEIHHGMIGVE